MNERASKAAIILLAMGGSLGSRLLKEFEPGEIRKFAHSAASLSEIDPTFLGNLVEEFSIEMNKPVLLRGGDQQTRSFLTEAMPADQVNKILGAEDVAFCRFGKTSRRDRKTRSCHTFLTNIRKP